VYAAFDVRPIYNSGGFFFLCLHFYCGYVGCQQEMHFFVAKHFNCERHKPSKQAEDIIEIAQSEGRVGF